MPITNHALSQFQSCLYISHCAFDNLRRALSVMNQALRLAVEPNTIFRIIFFGYPQAASTMNMLTDPMHASAQGYSARAWALSYRP